MFQDLGECRCGRCPGTELGMLRPERGRGRLVGLCLIVGMPTLFACTEPPYDEGSLSVILDLRQSAELYVSEWEKRGVGGGRKEERKESHTTKPKQFWLKRTEK